MSQGNNKLILKKICDECNMKLNNNAELGIHLREKHKKYYCGVCKSEFNNSEQLVDHLRINHNITNFKSLT
jgi:hypothetical protein